MDFTLSNARRFYSSLGNLLARKGLKPNYVFLKKKNYQLRISFLIKWPWLLLDWKETSKDSLECRLLMTKSWKFRRPVMKKLISVLAKKFTGKKKFWNWMEKIQTEKQVNLITSVVFSYSLKHRWWCNSMIGFQKTERKPTSCFFVGPNHLNSCMKARDHQGERVNPPCRPSN